MITGIPLPSSNFPRPGWPHPQILEGSPQTGHGQWRPGWVRSPTAGSERHAVRAGAAPLLGCRAGGSGANLGWSPTAPATGSAESVPGTRVAVLPPEGAGGSPGLSLPPCWWSSRGSWPTSPVKQGVMSGIGNRLMNPSLRAGALLAPRLPWLPLSRF